MSAVIEKWNERGGATVYALGAEAATLDALPDYATSAGLAEETALHLGNGRYACSTKTLKLLGFDWTTKRTTGGQVLSV